MPTSIFMIVLIVIMVGFMWMSSRKQKKRQEEQNQWKQSLGPGTEVATHSGLIGVITEIDLEKEQAVIDSEGSLSRWRLAALTQPPIVPAFISDDEVDENGDPIEPAADTVDAEVVEAPADTTDTADAIAPSDDDQPTTESTDTAETSR